MRKNKKPEWNVYHYDANAQKIYIFNIFDFKAFANDVKEIMPKIGETFVPEEFEEKLKRICVYWFAHNRNWEICVGDLPWWEDTEDDEKYIEQSQRWAASAKKISVWDQIEINWDRFVQYILENGEMRK